MHATEYPLGPPEPLTKMLIDKIDDHVFMARVRLGQSVTWPFIYPAGQAQIDALSEALDVRLRSLQLEPHCFAKLSLAALELFPNSLRHALDGTRAHDLLIVSGQAPHRIFTILTWNRVAPTVQALPKQLCAIQPLYMLDHRGLGLVCEVADQAWISLYPGYAFVASCMILEHPDP